MTDRPDTGIDTHAIGKRPGPVAWALLFPLLAWLVLFVVVPTLIMVVFSLLCNSPISTSANRTSRKRI